MYLPTSAISRTGLGRLISSTRARQDFEVRLCGRLLEAQLANQQRAETGLLEQERDLVDGRGRLGGNDGLAGHVGEESDLVADLLATGWSERRTMTSGWMPMPRSSLTECWVGLVLSSPVAARAGSSVTWT